MAENEARIMVEALDFYLDNQSFSDADRGPGGHVEQAMELRNRLASSSPCG